MSEIRKQVAPPDDGESYQLKSVKRVGSEVELPIYDDGMGPLFIHRDSMGISGVVRAQAGEDAYGIG